MFSLYLKITFITVVCIVIVAATINFFVDPSGVYGQKTITPEKYAFELTQKSKYGLLWQEGLFADRDLSKALAVYSKDVDCVVIGSSRIMQVSSKSHNKSFMEMCPSILNIGVSGASIEDHIALSYLVVKAGFSGDVIFGVDPWTLTYNKHQRWTVYSDVYNNARYEIFGDDDDVSMSPLLFLLNLINVEYTYRSVLLLMKYLKKGIPSIVMASDFDYEVGLDDPVKLPDGSHVYSKNYIQKSGNISIKDGKNHNWMVKTPVSSQIGSSDYQHLLKWVSMNDIKVHVLLTPYHHSAWAYNDTVIVSAMNKTENIIKKIAKGLGVAVYGSYNPLKVGCDNNEFYDVMHAKSSCLGKIAK